MNLLLLRVINSKLDLEVLGLCSGHGNIHTVDSSKEQLSRAVK